MHILGHNMAMARALEESQMDASERDRDRKRDKDADNGSM